jgi:hypothetical protein
MSLACFKNPNYRQNIVKCYLNATHVLDIPETNKAEYARAKAMHHTNMVKQICPLLIPVSAKELEDY